MRRDSRQPSLEVCRSCIVTGPRFVILSCMFTLSHRNVGFRELVKVVARAELERLLHMVLRHCDTVSSYCPLKLREVLQFQCALSQIPRLRLLRLLRYVNWIVFFRNPCRTPAACSPVPGNKWL